MVGPFELKPEHISALSDADLRTLVASLAREEMGAQRVPRASVVSGGHQDAPDGGIDVHVAVDAAHWQPDYVPNRRTGFQVKQSPMAPSAIKKEMKPNGLLRPAICELADAGGAYVIVSGKDNCSAKSLESRRQAMRDAVTSINLQLDFYDAARMCEWAGQHPGVVLWILERVGQPVSGWKSIDPNRKEGAAEQFVTDEQPRVHISEVGVAVTQAAPAIPIGEALVKVRHLLAQPGAVVRIIGLAGIGKTRFARAIFELSGEEGVVLPQAIYADNAALPIPLPQHLFPRLAHRDQPIIVVVDNLPGEQHQQLVNLCTGTHIGLLTIEHDIQDDQPPSTVVVHIGEAPESTIETIIARRYPKMDGANRRRIAHFARGNARIALHLASSVLSNPDIATLSDRVLLRRLLNQGHPANPLLERCARTLSLVYSFDQDAELDELSRLSGVSRSDLSEGIGYLRVRGLLQARENWRAMLPPALANQFASDALTHLDAGQLKEFIGSVGNSRLFASFCRRLGYLCALPGAKDIAERLLHPGGRLSNLRTLEGDELRAFWHLAPTAPDAVLAALEASPAIGELPEAGWDLNWALIQLSVEAEFMDRCFRIQSALLASGKLHDYNRQFVMAHFQCHYAPTRRSNEERIQQLRNWLFAAEAHKQEFGLLMLKGALTAGNFRLFNLSDFGGRPAIAATAVVERTLEAEWYRAVFDVVTEMVEKAHLLSEKGLEAFSVNFGALFHAKHLRSSLLQSIVRLGSAWTARWQTISVLLVEDAANLGEEDKTELRGLREMPVKAPLAVRIRAMVLIPEHAQFGLSNHHARGAADAPPMDEHVTHLAHELARDSGVFRELARELCFAVGPWVQTLLSATGAATGEARLYCRILERALHEVIDEKVMNPNLATLGALICGIAKQNEGEAISLLQGTLDHPVLRLNYIAMERMAAIRAGCYERLLHVIERDIVHPDTLRNVSYFVRSSMLTGVEACDLIWRVGIERNDVGAALSAAYTFDDNGAFDSTMLANLMRALVVKATTTERWHTLRADDQDTLLAHAITVAFAGGAAPDDFEHVCVALRDHLAHSQTATHWLETLGALAGSQSNAFLQHFLLDPAGTGMRILKFVRLPPWETRNPLLKTGPEVLCAWCLGDSPKRFELVAKALPPLFEQAPGQVTWTAHAKRLIDHAPNPETIVNEFALALGLGQRHEYQQSHQLMARWSLFRALESNLRLKEWVSIKQLEVDQQFAWIRKEELQMNTRANRFE